MIPALLDEAVAHHGRRVGVRDAGASWSWHEVAARVAAQAARLAAAGVRPGDRVALSAPNGAAFLEATFATARAGAVLVPLNVRLAPREQARVLDDAEPVLLLHEPLPGETAGPADLSAAVAAAERAHPVLQPLDAAWREPTGAPPTAPATRHPDDPAQLYYTSGTTGRPKGVVLTHRNVVAHAHNAIHELGLTAVDRWAHVAPMFHLADAWATLAVTAAGGLHVFLPRFDAAAALRLLEAERVTITNLVPTMLNDMLRHPDAPARDLAAMRLLLSGGAPIAPALVAEVEQVLGCPYAQTYGLTETSPYLTISLLDVRHDELDEAGRRAARARTGRPFRGVEVEVVDPSGEPVPADDRTVGEVRARGETVTPGYWRRPDETAAALRGGWFYTGDLATVDALGSLRIVDRLKDVVLTGGETVYSTEVEAVLYEHPDVLEAAVFGLPDPRWGEAVHAAVVPRPGRTLEPGALRAFCRERLAGYKVPKVVHVEDALPRTGSGKLAKRLLRERLAPSASPPAP